LHAPVAQSTPQIQEKGGKGGVGGPGGEARKEKEKRNRRTRVEERGEGRRK